MSATEVKGKISQEEWLVLIGATNYDYVSSLTEFIKDKKAVWSSWNFRIREKWRRAVLDRLKSQGKFPILFYLSKKMGGTGKVEFVGVFDDIKISDSPIKSPDPSLTNEWENEYPTEDFQSYTWFRFYEIIPLIPSAIINTWLK